MSQTRSICPECHSVIDATIEKKDGRVLITKECKDHGTFSDVYYSDSKLYDRFAKFGVKGKGLANPNMDEKHGCPYDCGICPNHKTSTLLANIDVTNRCNFSCPLCFANASKSGYVYEPTMEQIRGMFQALRDEKPVPCYAVQFAGGEPTMREELPEIINMARDMGFFQIMIATNGMKMARSKEYCKELRKTPLSTVYLQFDGVTEEPFIKLRGFNALPYKLKAIENMRETGLGNIVLVPTLVRDVNSGQAADIIRFAAKNIDIVRGVNFQPVSFSGRVETDELKKGRITIPDLLDMLEEQSGGALMKSDFFTCPTVTALSDIMEAWTGQPQVIFTIHPHCGAATYVFVDEKGNYTPITRFVDVDGLVETVERISHESRGSKHAKALIGEKLIREVPKYVEMKKMPPGMNVTKLLLSFVTSGDPVKALSEFHYNALMIGAMHFMDPYNLDMERVQSCGIHYATPDGRIIPFCTYNILYRQEIEKKFAVPVNSSGANPVPADRPALTELK
ncbi:MAG TPA: radical SAM protein [Methanocella sp.]|uniref:tetraether lipid synthase Tes n=1 Tax=Methanocella sp. TaxID=2052833 RepID=UPI002BE4D553|nr:radical SAM protein [Methanocella sp.]HTY91676.1 radical SAM protein [Methanocella sp.]